jgi:hypothetical protein
VEALQWSQSGQHVACILTNGMIKVFGTAMI